MEVMTTTVARGERRSAGRKAWVTWSVPTTLLSNMSRHSAGIAAFDPVGPERAPGVVDEHVAGTDLARRPP